MQKELVIKNVEEKLQKAYEDLTTVWCNIYQLRCELGIQEDYSSDLSKLDDNINAVTVEAMNLRDKIRDELK